MAKKIPAKSIESKIESKQQISIPSPKMKTLIFKIRGTSQYVQERFDDKSLRQMREKQSQGSQVAVSKKREPKDIQACYEGAMYRPDKGNWPNGAIPTTQIHGAMIGACRNLVIKMTEAKQFFSILSDGVDAAGKPLIKITKGTPEIFEQALPNANGRCDLRYRPRWKEGWEAIVRIDYDADMLSPESVANLLMRAGIHSGIGAGRPSSKRCAGCGWGTFELAQEY